MAEQSKLSVTALVPMRKGSERVPDKNMQPLGGVPLYKHVVRWLREAQLIDHIYIVTDYPEFSDPDVSGVIPIPEDVANADMNSAIAFALAMVDSDIFLQTHATNPFVFPSTFDRAILQFIELYSRKNYDSLFGVGPKIQKRFWTPDGRALNHDPYKLLRTQDLEGVHEENSCLYVFTEASFVKRGNRIGESPFMFEMPQTESLDIDTWEDLRAAQRRMDGDGKCQ